MRTGMKKNVEFHFTRMEILKYITVVLLIVYVVFVMLYQSGSTKPFEEVAEKVEDALDTTVLQPADDQALKRNFELNAADLDGVLYYSAESTVSAEEVLVIKVRSEDQVTQVTDAIENRIANQIEVLEGYVPEQVQLLQEAQISVRGNYIFMAVAQDAPEYADVFSKSL